MNFGILGEVRCVVTRADGVTKTDTGYQKNLILNQGLNFFGGGKGSAINTSCAIGSGNSSPLAAQTKLDVFVAIASGSDTTSSYSYINKGDDLYRMWEQKKYRFTGLSEVNITEVGLVSEGSASNYYLTTRALIKDSAGNPTSITVKTGETLDVYYKVHKVVDISDKSFVVNVSNGSGGPVPYNIIIRPKIIGTDEWSIGMMSPVSASAGFTFAGGADISAANSSPIGLTQFANSFTLSSYILGSYKIVAKINYALAQANGNIRTVMPDTNYFRFLHMQMRFGRASDDAPLVKTNKETLEVPLEFSWSRYEGVL